MNNKTIALIAAIVVAALAAAQAPAQAPPQQQDSLTHYRMYGYQLMTEAERAEYLARMRSLQTYEERKAFRLEHHKKMQERAKERGVTLPDSPPAHGMGQGRRQEPPGGGQHGPREQGGGPHHRP